VEQRNLYIGGIVVIGALSAFTYFSFFDGEQLEVVQPVRGPAVEAIYATGTVEPVQVARVGAKISGRISQVLAHEGDTVVAGEVLAILDHREASASVRELEARLEFSKAEVNRYRRLFRSGNTSAAARDQAESNFRSAEAALEAANVRLQEHFLRAAISGNVMRTEQQLDVGYLVSQGKVLFVVGDPGNLWVEAEVDEEDIPRVMVTQRALIRADAFADQALEGKVEVITPFGDPIARTYRVHIGLPNDTPLLSGMTTEINIVVREVDDALLVPTSAVRDGGIWIVTGDNIVSHREITPGAQGEDLTEIREGATVDDWILVSPPLDIKEGASIRVDDRDELSQ
jgi:membrane fusion protein, multidrug efflux system